MGMNMQQLAEHCDTALTLESRILADEYFYQSLPLCVIDSVYSIGVRYTSTQMVVKRYCDYFELAQFRPVKTILPAIETQESISTFVSKIEELGIEKFTQEIFVNRQRTSTSNGILKSEAVYRFAQLLQKHGVDYFQDIPRVLANLDFEAQIKTIPGQRSGVSLDYFYMLAGSSDLIKPDRMILRFLQTALDRPVSTQEALPILREITLILKNKYPDLTARSLDYAIWEYQRDI